ncbi:MAG: putative acyl-CoA dehydrogenase [Actinomycetia bacterium]|nr:putative acyl-CoA dehydrogenase [Actinomycetes bacterium]
MADDPVTEVKAWLEENWDPDLTVREWWERLGTSGWAAPTWPVEWYGKGLSNAENNQVQRTITEFGALGPPGGLGMLLAGPTIATHGTDEQKAHYLADIVTGRVGWCQLFSEPVAGSDLAGLQTRAIKDGDEWVVNGQKVWTSSAHVADIGMLMARTNTDVPKHKGITYFAIDMHQEGMDVRPLRELTGRALFNEVFMTDVRVADDAIIGGRENGWAVANTTLAFERAGLGAGGGNAAESAALPGTIPGHLDRRAGDFVRPKGSKGSGSATFSVTAQTLIDAARRHDKLGDPVVRQGIARMYIEGELGRYMSLRHRALRMAGQDLPGMGNLAKLRMSEMFRQSRDVGLAILGARGMLHSYDDGPLPGVEDDGVDRAVTAVAMWSPGPSIYGGTDQVQRNILGERILGLPREPGDDRNTPFKDLRKNA